MVVNMHILHTSHVALRWGALHRKPVGYEKLFSTRTCSSDAGMMRLAHYKGTRLGWGKRGRPAPETGCSRACICFFSEELPWMISTDIHIFFLFACEFSTLPSRCMWCFCRRTKGLGFWALVGILDIPPPTEDHIHLISEIETQPKRRKPRWFEGIFLWETTRWPDIGQPLIWGDIFFSFLQPRIGTTARWSTHWSALDTSTTCPWIASPQNSVAEGIAWTGLRWKILSPTTPSGFSTSLCTIYPSRCRKSDESVKQRQQT